MESSLLNVNYPIKISKKHHISSTCLICDGRNNLQALTSSCFIKLKEDISFKDMFLKCYNMDIQCDNKCIVPEICRECVTKLQDAYMFRKKIENIACDHRTLIYKYVNHNKMLVNILTHLRNTKSEDDKPLSDLNLERKIKSDIIERLKKTNKIHYRSCSIQKIETMNGNIKKKYKAKEKKAKPKNCNSKISNIINNTNSLGDKMFDDMDILWDKDFLNDVDNISCSSVNSDDINVATGFNKHPETKKKEMLLIPALQYSATSCPLCGMVPNSKQSLLRHYYDTHFPSFLCHLCGYSTTLPESFNSHMKTHRGVKYPCSSCSKVFSSPITRYHHEKAIHRKIPMFNCNICDATFSHSVIRRKHMFEKHGVECRNHPCSECGKIFYSEHRLSVHVKRSHLHYRPFHCTQCSQSFFQMCHLREHMTKHTGAKDFHCNECGKYFSRRGCLREHLKIHNNVRNFMCHLCHKTFIQRVSLKTHIKTHHKQDAETASGVTVINNIKFINISHHQ